MTLRNACALDIIVRRKYEFLSEAFLDGTGIVYRRLPCALRYMPQRKVDTSLRRNING
jgi:hypothetical protein